MTEQETPWCERCRSFHPATTPHLPPPKKIGPPPTHCPYCASKRIVVRIALASICEMACEDCERTAVISVDDTIKL